jgi:hypothetical protein
MNYSLGYVHANLFNKRKTFDIERLNKIRSGMHSITK